MKQGHGLSQQYVLGWQVQCPAEHDNFLADPFSVLLL
jgi:hypothetical protein